LKSLSRLAACCLLVSHVVSAAAAPPQRSGTESIARGRAYFTTCAGCHGTQAQGNSGMHAPNLTVQGGAYLLDQLRHFVRGIRGGPTDFYGWQMNGRAKALPNDAALRDVVAYIGSLAKYRAVATVQADVNRGRSLYRNCAGCHGAHAQGSAGVSGGAARATLAPALAGLDYYYQLAQLKAFRNGARGAHKDDSQGAVMRAAAGVLKSEQDAQDVVAFISSLRP
jgi:cytochrome c553